MTAPADAPLVIAAFDRHELKLAAGAEAHLERWPDLEGFDLAARHLRVWVPAGSGPWPVLLMHDGQNLFDPGAIWGGWRLQETLPALTGDVLVVGLDNTWDRMEEYTHVPDLGYDSTGDAYVQLLAESVLPWVETAYPTTAARGVLGSSLGGLISLHAADRYPDLFDWAGSMSGTLWWGQEFADGELMEQRWRDAGHRSVALFLDSGGGPGPDGQCRDVDGDGFVEDDPDGSDNYCATRGFADGMAEVGWTWDADLWHWWEIDAEHDERAWADRVHRPLQSFLDLAAGSP